MTSPEASYIVLNAGGVEEWNIVRMYSSPTIKFRNPNPNPTPRAPRPEFYEDHFESFGCTYISFVLSNLNLEGDLLDTKNMYYEVYIDGELLTFDTQDYPISEDMQKVPYDLNLSSGITSSYSGHSMYLYFSNYDTVGLRLYNVVDGETYASGLTVWNIIDDTYVVEEDPSSVETVSIDKAAASTEYYTLQGVRLDRPVPGITICKTTLEDGSVKVSKVLVK